MSRDFLLLVFFHESVFPQPQSNPLGLFHEKNRSRKSRDTVPLIFLWGSLPPNCVHLHCWYPAWVAQDCPLFLSRWGAVGPQHCSPPGRPKIKLLDLINFVFNYHWANNWQTDFELRTNSKISYGIGWGEGGGWLIPGTVPYLCT